MKKQNKKSIYKEIKDTYNINVITKKEIKQENTTSLNLNIEKWKLDILKRYSEHFKISLQDILINITTYITTTINDYLTYLQQYKNTLNDFTQLLKYQPNKTHKELLKKMNNFIKDNENTIKYEIFTTNNKLTYRINNIKNQLQHYEQNNEKLINSIKQNFILKEQQIKSLKDIEQIELINKKRHYLNETLNNIIVKLYETNNNVILSDNEKQILINNIENKNK